MARDRSGVAGIVRAGSGPAVLRVPVSAVRLGVLGVLLVAASSRGLGAAESEGRAVRAVVGEGAGVVAAGGGGGGARGTVGVTGAEGADGCSGSTTMATAAQVTAAPAAARSSLRRPAARRIAS